MDNDQTSAPLRRRRREIAFAISGLAMGALLAVGIGAGLHVIDGRQLIAQTNKSASGNSASVGAIDSGEGDAAAVMRADEIRRAFNRNGASRTPWFKEAFSAAVMGETKAQFRDDFGPPRSVEDSTNSWYYYNIPVYDRDAGTAARQVIVRFFAIDGPTEKVVEVRYN
jgi:hypothetical protein